MSEVKEQTNEIINILSRKKIEITSVIEVLSSTENEVVAKLVNDYICVYGHGLKITKLSPEEKQLILAGDIFSVQFVSKLNKKSFFKKVFK